MRHHLTCGLTLALVLMALAATTACQMSGNSGAGDYVYETYILPSDTADPQAFREDRKALARAVRDTLLTHRFFAESNTLNQLGRGELVTQWNSDDARRTIGTYQGYRYKVFVELIDDPEESVDIRAEDDPIRARNLELSRPLEGRRVALGINVRRQTNTAMTQVGSLKGAEWSPDGDDRAFASRIQYEVRRAFNEVASLPQRVTGSKRTERILAEDERYRRGTNAPPAPRPPSGPGATGPTGGSNDSDLFAPDKP